MLFYICANLLQMTLNRKGARERWESFISALRMLPIPHGLTETYLISYQPTKNPFVSKSLNSCNYRISGVTRSGRYLITLKLTSASQVLDLGISMSCFYYPSSDIRSLEITYHRHVSFALSANGFVHILLTILLSAYHTIVECIFDSLFQHDDITAWTTTCPASYGWPPSRCTVSCISP